MKLNNNSIIYSASDITSFVNCEHLVHNTVRKMNGEIKQPFFNNKTVELLQERGQNFEAKILDSYKNKNLNVVEIQPHAMSAIQDTLAAMQAGADIIYQAKFEQGNWMGIADFLIKTDKISNLGEWSYEVIDTKLTNDTKASTIIQITLYSFFLEQIQGVLPEFMYVKTPHHDEVYRVLDYTSYVRFVQKKVEVNAPNIKETYPQPVNHCDICKWWTVCNDRRRADDHLCFIAGMGATQTKEFESQGFNTLSAVAEIPDNMPCVLPNPIAKGSEATYQRLIHQAKLQKQSKEEGIIKYDILPLHPSENLGFKRLPLPSKGDIYFDFEGDPLIEPSGLEYLFGWVHKQQYHKIWVRNEAEERAALILFIDTVTDLLKINSDLHIYHFSPYETVALKRLVSKYGVKENELDNFLRSELFVDLHAVFKQAVRAGVEKYSLKDLEPLHGFERKIDLQELSKEKSMLEFLLESEQIDNIPDELKERVERYNEEDCRSTESIHIWLENQRNLNFPDLDRLVANSVPPDNLSDFLKNILPIKNKLLEGLFDDRGILIAEFKDLDNEQQAKLMLAHMLEWYRREEKTFWWEFFRVRDLEDDELFDEKVAIAGLQLIPNRGEQVIKSFTDVYSFPNQDTDVRVNDDLKLKDGTGLGSVYKLDFDNNEITILKGPTKRHIHPTAVTNLKNIPTKIKEDAIISFAEFIADFGFDVDDTSCWKPAIDLLLKKLPDYKSVPSTDSDLIQSTFNKLQVLNNSILSIQGPPGTGKSYTAAHLIIKLIAQGKKIGIAALSHKVIENLISKVHEINQTDYNLSIMSIQKVSSDDNKDLAYWHKINKIDTIVSQLPTTNIIAGTSFFFANNKVQGALDYLFIDEAGQLSLVDTLSMVASAKNLVLLGDPQQLQQPQQGTHPYNTEVSALEHVLDGAATITDDKGVFLAKTWRMHPKLTQFVSINFYDNKLFSVDGLENQSIKGSLAFPNPGIYIDEVNHEANTNESKEEAKRVIAILKDLLDGTKTFIDKDGLERTLQATDIKIITPYNAQLQLINKLIVQHNLPSIQIGTVDKFQGQEAPVIICSMATSSAEDAPRGMDFIYSPNRLNVAVSRAKALFIMVASSKLFEANCKSPKQLKLVNPFCSLRECAM
jgi:uncharacterized protein